MPIKIPSTLPASQILESENIFVMDTERAYTQDIRPLKILILNLMPNKTVTETQLLRLLGNTPLQIEVDFIYTESYLPKHTSIQYLSQFYGTFEDVKDKYYDGFIITGAPVERMEYEEVAYWKEVCEIMDWSRKHAWSTFHICWIIIRIIIDRNMHIHTSFYISIIFAFQAIWIIFRMTCNEKFIIFQISNNINSCIAFCHNS